MIREFPFCKYHDDGIIEVYGNKDGMPLITAVVPAPGVNTKNGIERQKRYDDAINGITLQGYYITHQKLIKNQAFDKKGQKTTLELIYRPCTNKSEIEQVYVKILNLLGRGTENYKAIEVGEVPK